MIEIENMVGNVADYQQQVDAILHTATAKFEKTDMEDAAETIKPATAYIKHADESVQFIDDAPFSAALSRLNADCIKVLRLLSQQSLPHIFPKPNV